ncbi:MAG: Asp-tRNA(Asn)/Glu-tRNA(Gln) amidotransferase subunit GatC [Egibacteraceae bacterium]
MSLSTEEVRHVARLARLALTDEEVESLRSQLSDILAYAEKVGEVAASDVPPTGHAYPLRNVLRADEPRPSLTADEALSTAPEPQDGRFQVPRIVGEEPQPDGGDRT